MNAIYERIYQLCLERGEKITPLCKRAGISPSRLSDLRNGRSSGLSTATLSKLAKELNTTPEYLMSGSQPNVLVVDADAKEQDYRYLIRVMETEDLVQLMRDAADELRLRTLPARADLSDFSEDELFDKIREYTGELGRRRGQGGGAAVKLRSDEKE